jgi:hypothetical protein
MNGDVKENIVASVIDIVSIVGAYNLGVHHLDWWAGLGYAGLDAWIVIWQRKRMTRLLHAVGERLRVLKPPTGISRVGRIVWEIQPTGPQP